MRVSDIVTGKGSRGPVTDHLEFSFRMLVCICTPETLALAFAGVFFMETFLLVIRPRSRAQGLPPALLRLFFCGHFLLLDDAKLALLGGLAVLAAFRGHAGGAHGGAGAG
jgi:hypothetical protein